MSGSLSTVAGKLGRYRLDLVVVYAVRWDEGRTVRAADYTFFCGKGSENHMGTGFFVYHRMGE